MRSILASTGAPAGGFPAWTVAPFAALLLCIALLPLAAPRWWHSNRNKGIVAAALGLPALGCVLAFGPGALWHAVLEYLAFIALLGSLYTISGGIRITGALPATPASNTALMAVGALLANLVGTTGAAMLLIRPLLHANRARVSRTHLVVFFILIVANCGGLLTPLGDPPLFLGFLRGVPFAWTLGLWPYWAFVVGALLAAFFAVDLRHARREASALAVAAPEPLGLQGAGNFLLLAGVVGTVLLCGFVVYPRLGEQASFLIQIAGMALLGLASLRLTPRALRAANGFSWHPIAEVAVLFAAIFVAMIPALDVLRTRGPALGIDRPWEFFWATGLLSGFLDNAPTYVAFVEMGQFLPDEVVGTSTAALTAISCGAVFFGALTYIGNGPNFMVKAIAEEAGVPMPSFFAYLAWSAAILLPVLALTRVVF